MADPDPDFIDALCEARRKHGYAPGIREACEDAARRVLAFLFPHFAPAEAGMPRCEPSSVHAELAEVRSALGAALARMPQGADPQRNEQVEDAFLARLPVLRELILDDARALVSSDPAAETLDEVLLAYPGLRAMALHRVAHELVHLGVALAPRLIAELAHRETGVDIHPAAHIGRSVAIDHGTGVVIGETAVIGERVKLYQGVTLGAASVRKELGGKKRHPTIGDDVVVYANATILGDVTVGAGSVIGGNVWLTHSVPPRSLVMSEGAVTRVRSKDEEAPLDFSI